MPGSSFELSLSQLADAQLAQEAPSLADHKIGFQLIDKNDDDTRGVGVMVYKVGSQWIYVPVFYLNGRIKGTNLMYLQQQSIFAPCKENWLTFFKSKQASPLAFVADADEKKRSEEGKSGTVSIRGPETRMIKSAGSSAFSIVEDSDLSGMFDAPARSDATDLRRWIPRMGKKAAANLLYALNTSSTFANRFLEHYSLSDLETMVKTASDKSDNAGTVKEKPAATSAVQIITIGSPEADTLDEAQKAVLVKDRIFIVDRRESTSTVFRDSPASTRLNTPTAPGLYQVMMQDGSYKKFMVFLTGAAVDGCPGTAPLDGIWRSDTIYLAEPGSDKAAALHSRDILASAIPGGKSFSEIGRPVSELKNRDDVFADFLVIDRKGTAKVVKVAGSDGFIGNTLKVRLQGRNEPCHLKLVDHEGVLYRASDTLFVPRDARFLEIDYKPIYTGSLKALCASLKDKSGVRPLKVYSDGLEVELSGNDYTTGRISKTAAIKELVLRHGIAAETAKIMVKEASAHHRPHSDRYLIKLASATPVTMDSLVGRAAPDELIEEEIGGRMEKDDISMLEDAASKGQKDVMDVSVLKVLAIKSDVLEQINEYVPDLIKGMDRIGRLLFLFYWHNEDFKDRYGASDMTDLEDSLKDVFDSLSDLVLFLHKKSISPASVLETSTGDLSENIGI